MIVNLRESSFLRVQFHLFFQFCFQLLNLIQEMLLLVTDLLNIDLLLVQPLQLFLDVEFLLLVLSQHCTVLNFHFVEFTLQA